MENMRVTICLETQATEHCLRTTIYNPSRMESFGRRRKIALGHRRSLARWMKVVLHNEGEGGDDQNERDTQE